VPTRVRSWIRWRFRALESCAFLHRIFLCRRGFDLGFGGGTAGSKRSPRIRRRWHTGTSCAFRHRVVPAFDPHQFGGGFTGSQGSLYVRRRWCHSLRFPPRNLPVPAFDPHQFGGGFTGSQGSLCVRRRWCHSLRFPPRNLPVPARASRGAGIRPRWRFHLLPKESVRPPALVHRHRLRFLTPSLLVPALGEKVAWIPDRPHPAPAPANRSCNAMPCKESLQKEQSTAPYSGRKAQQPFLLPRLHFP